MFGPRGAAAFERNRLRLKVLKGDMGWGRLGRRPVALSMSALAEKQTKLQDGWNIQSTLETVANRAHLAPGLRTMRHMDKQAYGNRCTDNTRPSMYSRYNIKQLSTRDDSTGAPRPHLAEHYRRGAVALMVDDVIRVSHLWGRQEWAMAGRGRYNTAV